jgi:hypothetical protein
MNKGIISQHIHGCLSGVIWFSICIGILANISPICEQLGSILRKFIIR